MRTVTIAEVIAIVRRVKLSIEVYHVEMNLYSDCEEYINRRR